MFVLLAYISFTLWCFCNAFKLGAFNYSRNDYNSFDEELKRLSQIISSLTRY